MGHDPYRPADGQVDEGLQSKIGAEKRCSAIDNRKTARRISGSRVMQM
jgi:hypothetical protein